MLGIVTSKVHKPGIAGCRVYKQSTGTWTVSVSDYSFSGYSFKGARFSTSPAIVLRRSRESGIIPLSTR